MTEEQIKSLQSTGGDHLAATEKNILGNHLNNLWEYVKTIRAKTGGRIDFVLDNAGFELYCDCVYGTDLSPFSFRVFLKNVSWCSRFPHSDRARHSNSIPREAFRMVCLGRCAVISKSIFVF
jgi:hypothetical protein